MQKSSSGYSSEWSNASESIKRLDGQQLKLDCALQACSLSTFEADDSGLSDGVGTASGILP